MIPTKRKESAEIIHTGQLAADVYEMILKTELASHAVAGQFVAVYTKDASRLLPRPISICETDHEKKTLRLVYRILGAGTKEFSTYQTGQKAELLGTLGNGYPLEPAKGKKILLLGGGIGIPPLLELAKCLQGEKVTIVLGYRDNQMFLKEDFEHYGNVYVATEDGSAGQQGNVFDALEKSDDINKLNHDIIYSCGPMPMLRAVKRYAKEKNIPAYLSMEERMACGIGACLGCVCKTVHKDLHSHVYNARICTEGPVFLAEDVAILPEEQNAGEEITCGRK